MQEYLEIGQIVNTFGIKGMVKVTPFTDDITRFNSLKQVFLVQKKEKVSYGIEEVKYQNHMVLLKLNGIDTIEQAQLLKNAYLVIERKDAVELPNNTYFIVDLIGIIVSTDKGEKLGIIEDVYTTKSNDIYVVRTEQGKQILLPAISDVILQVDIQNKKMIVHVIEGLQ